MERHPQVERQWEGETEIETHTSRRDRGCGENGGGEKRHRLENTPRPHHSARDHETETERARQEERDRQTGREARGETAEMGGGRRGPQRMKRRANKEERIGRGRTCENKYL